MSCDLSQDTQPTTSLLTDGTPDTLGAWHLQVHRLQPILRGLEGGRYWSSSIGQTTQPSSPSLWRRGCSFEKASIASIPNSIFKCYSHFIFLVQQILIGSSSVAHLVLVARQGIRQPQPRIQSLDTVLFIKIHFESHSPWDLFFSPYIEQWLANISVKSHAIILSVLGHPISVSATQLCSCSLKGVPDNMQMKGCSCVAIKLYLFKKKAKVHIWRLANTFADSYYTFAPEANVEKKA